MRHQRGMLGLDDILHAGSVWVGRSCGSERKLVLKACEGESERQRYGRLGRCLGCAI